METMKRLNSTLPGEKNREHKTLLRHQIRLIDICDQILKGNNSDPEFFLEHIRELRKELSKL